jgi:type I restriction enzyme M protein
MVDEKKKKKIMPATSTLSQDNVVPEGYVIDFLTGKFVKDTPEEYVRQNIEKALVRQYHYNPSECEPEFRIKMGSSKPRVDIVIFKPNSDHIQENASILVETKKAGTNPTDKKEGIGQLKSYMAACLNAKFGMWTNGDDRFCFAKVEKAGSIAFREIVDIPTAGSTDDDIQKPKRKDLAPATADNLLFAFRRCHNYIAGTEGLQKAEACFGSAKFGPLMIFLKRWIAYNKITQGEMHEYQEKAIA